MWEGEFDVGGGRNDRLSHKQTRAKGPLRSQVYRKIVEGEFGGGGRKDLEDPST